MKAALCVHCSDVVTPFRDWQTNRNWRWCQCDHTAVRWVDGARGLLEVTSMHGPGEVRVIGLNNSFLAAAVQTPLASAEEWRMLHAESCRLVGPGYLFHEERRACWALVVRPGESNDVTFVPWVEAYYGTDAGAGGPNAHRQVTSAEG